MPETESTMIDNNTPEELFAALKSVLDGYPALRSEDMTRVGDPMWRLADQGIRAMHDPPSGKREYSKVRRRWLYECGAGETGVRLQLDLLVRPDGNLKAGLYGRSKDFPTGDANTPHATFKGRLDAATGEYLLDFRSKPVTNRLQSSVPAYLSAANARPSRLLLGRVLDRPLIHRFILATDLAGQARQGVQQARDPASFYPPV